MHYENMIISKKSPCLIDLECSFNSMSMLNVHNTGLIYDTSGKCAFDPGSRKEVSGKNGHMVALPEKNLIYYYDDDRQVLVSYIPEYDAFKKGLFDGMRIISMRPEENAHGKTVSEWFSQDKVKSMHLRFIPCATELFLTGISHLAEADYSMESFQSKIVPDLKNSERVADPAKVIFTEANMQALYNEMAAHSVPWYYMSASNQELYDFNSQIIMRQEAGEPYFVVSPLEHARQNCKIIQRGFSQTIDDAEAKAKVEEIEKSCYDGLERVRANNNEDPFVLDVSIYKQYYEKISAIRSLLPAEYVQVQLVEEFKKEVQEILLRQKKWYHLFYKPDAIKFRNFISAEDELKIITNIFWAANFFAELKDELTANADMSPQMKATFNAILELDHKYKINEIMFAKQNVDRKIREATEDLERQYEEKYKFRTGDHNRVFWTAYHRLAIEKLIDTRKMSLNQAIDEVAGLDDYQVDGITKGLSRQEVIGLFKFEIMAYLAFRNLGLTAELLHESRPYSEYFSSGHYQALSYLMLERKMPAAESMFMLRKITDPIQAIGISLGLSLKEVNELNNEQILTYESLRNHGITVKQLQKWQPQIEENEYNFPYNAFLRSHRVALINFIKASNSKPEVAINEIYGLNEQQVYALLELSPLGLNGKDLQGWQGKQFTPQHRENLNHMIKAEGIPAKQAIAELYFREAQASPFRP